MTDHAREVIAASEAASSRLRTGSGVRARPSSAPFLKGSSRLSPADRKHISDLEAQIDDLQTDVEVQYLLPSNQHSRLYSSTQLCTLAVQARQHTRMPSASTAAGFLACCQAQQSQGAKQTAALVVPSLERFIQAATVLGALASSHQAPGTEVYSWQCA